LTTITCHVADDHPPVVHALVDYLGQHGLEIAGVSGNGRDALEAIRRSRPAVAVLDLAMPLLTGIDVVRELPRTGEATNVVLYTEQADPALLDEAIDAGIHGVVLKEAPLSELLRAVQLAAAGRSYVDPVLAGMVSSPTRAARTPELTTRERDVLRLLADGLKNETIGKRLFISPETVRTHIEKAMAKLGAGTRTQAVASALRLSIIS
jgi:DNA-binding NarL/FixJ family response regulator